MRAYSGKRGPEAFTRRQFIARLGLKTFLHSTCRGVSEQPALTPAVREAIGPRKIPRWTTLQKFADRTDLWHMTTAA